MKTLSILITDMGFIVPSMQMAEQLTRPDLARLTDVMVFVLDPPEGFIEALRQEFGSPSVRLVGLSTKDFAASSDYARYFKGHVPLAALARLEICDMIPDCYDRVMYLDGDMQLVGDIAPLLQLEVPEGRIAAAVENFVMFEGPGGRRPDWLESYLAALQLGGAGSYFNSGLMLFRRTTWAKVAPRALDFFLTHADICAHHDQSALNAVCAGDWLPLSPAYNYLTFYLKMGGLDGMQPKILHFASAPKPWQSPESPWPPRHAETYRRFMDRHPALQGRLTVYDPAQVPPVPMRAVRATKVKARALLKTPGLARNFRRYVRRTQFLLD